MRGGKYDLIAPAGKVITAKSSSQLEMPACWLCQKAGGESVHVSQEAPHSH